MISSPRAGTPVSQAKKNNNRRHLHRSSGVYSMLPHSPKIHYPVDINNLPLDSQTNTEKFEQLSDAFEELDANLTNLQLIHEAICDGFNESFASFLYGLSITMWCVDFPGCPSKSQWERIRYVSELDSRIDGLKNQIEAARTENEKLKNELTTQAPVELPPRKKQTPIKGPLHKENSGIRDPISKKKPTMPHTSSTLASTRIPQPILRTVKNRTSMTSGPKQTANTSTRDPNLDQPPRYMRGIASSSARSSKPNRTIPSKIVNRPPFR